MPARQNGFKESQIFAMNDAGEGENGNNTYMGEKTSPTRLRKLL